MTDPQYTVGTDDEASPTTGDATGWAALQMAVTAAREDLEERQRQLWWFMEERAVRGAAKPYETCGDEDAWHPRHEEGHPDYDEDDLVPHVVCQLAKNHRALGYRNHLELDADGTVSGAWS